MSGHVDVLRLKRASPPAHAPAAWFIPGDSADEWLAELARWEVPVAQMRLYVVPRSIADRAAAGVLVIPLPGVKPTRTGRAVAYGSVGGRVFIPLDATLSPPVADAEIRAAMPLNLYVLHPTIGLVGFSTDEGHAADDLLEPPARREGDWDRARQGGSDVPRLVSVEPEQTPSLVGVIEAGRDDIGREAPDSLPPAEDESTIAEMMSRAAMPPLKLLGMLPMFGGRAAWATGKLSGISKALNEARFRELERLRKMLENDPDEGLRHAIPLRDVGTRGRATPGWRLGTRDVNFNRSSLFGGGGRMGDPWHVPPDMVAQLTQRYREAANRELRLGRYRRAAYIFAELLGDFTAAASALEQGRHYREAAVLYRDHLKNARKAAECLEHGGLLSEAIAIYDELGMHEKSGDVHATLEQHEAAARSYRTQVMSYVSKHQLLAAAGLLETKLKAPDEALDLLTDAWPRSDAAGECLRETFALLARLGRHAETSNRLGRLRAELPPMEKGPTLANVLSHVATSYPEESVRLLSADATRVIASNVLPGVEGETRRSVARAVARVAPEDRLLARDVERFITQLPRRPVSLPPRRKAMRTANDPVVLRQFRLPDGVMWRAAVAAPGTSGFLAIGSVSNGVLLLRGTWEGITQSTYWKHDAPERPALRTWHLQPVPGKALLIVSPSPRPERHVVLPQNDTFPSALRVTIPAWMPNPALRALAHTSSGNAWVLSEPHPEAFVLSLHRVIPIRCWGHTS
jgi:tetratricopeptide (TPR) repeat protein